MNHLLLSRPSGSGLLTLLLVSACSSATKPDVNGKTPIEDDGGYEIGTTRDDDAGEADGRAEGAAAINPAGDLDGAVGAASSPAPVSPLCATNVGLVPAPFTFRHVYSKAIGGMSALATSTATDSLGSVFVGGQMWKSFKVDDETRTIPSHGIFLLKLSPSGTKEWLKAIAVDDVDSYSEAALASDGADGVVLATLSAGAPDFGGGKISPAGKGALALAHYRADGSLLMSRSVPLDGIESAGSPRGVVINSEGAMFVAGGYRRPMGDGVIEGLYLLGIGPSGDVRFQHEFPHTLVDHGTALSLTSMGRVVLAGAFDATTDFGLGPVLPPSGSTSPHPGFVASFDDKGKAIFNRSFGVEANRGDIYVAADGKGDTIIGGPYGGALDLGTDRFDVGAGGYMSGYVAKLDPSGSTMFAKSWEVDTSGEAAVQAVAGSAAGDVAAGGYFEGQLTMGAHTMQTRGGRDIVVAAWGSCGALRGVKQVGTSASNEMVTSVMFDPQGDIIVAGDDDGEIDFGGGPLPLSQTDLRIYVAKLAP